MPDTVPARSAALPLVGGPQAWRGAEQVARSDWAYVFSSSEIAEIDTALAGVRNTEILAIDSATFPLPTLSSRLADIKREILEGRGFFLLRGLPIAQSSIE